MSGRPWESIEFFAGKEPIRTDGEVSVWIEEIDGHVYLCVGDGEGGDARYIPWDEVSSLRLEAEDLVEDICGREVGHG